MKKLFLLLIMASSFVAASAQRAYFAYFQTEDQSPFYLRIADKIYSSASSGYLILPNLQDSIYTIHLGFAKSTVPETRFALPVKQGDKGYLIKNFTDGLALFDMQNLTVIKPSTSNQASLAYDTRSDRFSTVLSKAADDPNLLQVAKKGEKQKEVVAITEEPKPVTTVSSENNSQAALTDSTQNVTTAKSVQDTIATVATPPPAETVEPPMVQTETNLLPIEQPYKRSTVRRYAESSTTEGLGIVYFDQSETAIDTIRILIPPSKIKFEETSVQATEVPKGDQPPSASTVEISPIKTESQSDSKPIISVNGTCPGIASEKDFVKLRKNMAGKETDEEMVAEARKAFKNKCFTTEQVRYLGSLFLTSAARYQFFDAAYNHVSDKQAFNSLQSEIKDEYYLKRFKALIGE